MTRQILAMGDRTEGATLDLSRPVQTVGGSPVRLLATDVRSLLGNIVGIVNYGDGSQAVVQWQSNGRMAELLSSAPKHPVEGCIDQPHCNPAMRLVNVPRKKERVTVWLYRDALGVLRSGSYAESEGCSAPHDPIGVTTVEVEYEERRCRE